MSRLATTTLLALLAFLKPAALAEERRAPAVKVAGALSLEAGVRVALKQNPDILRAIQEIERTRGQRIEVRAEALPHLTLNVSYDQQDPVLLESSGGGGGGGQVSFRADGQGVGGAAGGETVLDLGQLFAGSGSRSAAQDKSWRIAFELRQLIYDGGRLGAALKIARELDDIAVLNLRDTVDRTIAKTRTQFYEVLEKRALITVAEETVKLQEDLLRDQKNRFDAGTVPRFNVLRAEVELANVTPRLIRARNDAVLAQLDLAKTLGLAPGSDGKTTFSAEGALPFIERRMSLREAIELGRSRRTFLKIQRKQILVEKERVKVELAGYKPRIDARAGYEFRNKRSSDNLDDVVNGWFFGVTGSWSIFDGFETAGKVQQARAKLESAHVNYDDSVRQVELEISQAAANLETAASTIRSQRKNVEQALEALRLANERLAAGAGTQLEVLDARVALTGARTTELQARGDYNKALAEFDRATAVDTIYDDSFADPLAKIEGSVLKRAPAKKPRGR